MESYSGVAGVSEEVPSLNFGVKISDFEAETETEVGYFSKMFQYKDGIQLQT